MPNLQNRKLEIIERVLHLDTEDALNRLEQALDSPLPIPGEDKIPTMPYRNEAEMAARLAQARADIRAGRTLTTEELLARLQIGRAA